MKYFIMALWLLPTRALFTLAAEPAPVHFSQSLLLEDGDLGKLRQSLTKVFQFTTEDGKLKIDRAAWDRAAKEIPPADDGFGKIQQDMQQAMANDPQSAAGLRMAMAMNQVIAGMSGPTPPLVTLFEGIRKESGMSGGGHGSSGAGDDATWHSSFSGDGLIGQVEASKNSEVLTLQEAQAPRRTLKFRTFNQSGFWLELSNNHGDLISLRQEIDGRFTLIALSSDGVLADQSESFAEFCRLHRDWMESELLPPMAKFGFCPVVAEKPEVGK